MKCRRARKKSYLFDIVSDSSKLQPRKKVRRYVLTWYYFANISLLIELAGLGEGHTNNRRGLIQERRGGFHDRRQIRVEQKNLGKEKFRLVVVSC